MKIVVLFSGGLDSAVLLGHALSKKHDCLALTFRYGQTHEHNEVAAAINVAKWYGVEHRIIDITGVFTGSALLGDNDIPERHAEAPDTTTVPARNLVMLSIAASIADQVGAPAVMFGANKDDAAGYVDCRDMFCQALDNAISLGTTFKVSLWTPLLWSTKKDIAIAGLELGVPMELTWSCYRGGVTPCGRCGACESRDAALS